MRVLNGTSFSTLTRRSIVDVGAIIGVVSVGLGFMTYKMVVAAGGPDVHWDKSDRKTAVRGEEMERKGEAWAKQTAKNYSPIGQGLETSSVMNLWQIFRGEGDYRPGRSGPELKNDAAWRSAEDQRATYVKPEGARQ